MYRLSVICVLALMPTAFARAAEPDPRAAFVVLEITTPLQKRFVGDDLTVVAMIDGDVVLHDSTLNADGIDLDLFQARLSTVGARAHSSILLYTRVTGNTRRSGQALLDKALTGIAHDARFQKIRIGQAFDQGAWEDKLDRANKSMIGQSGIDEDATRVGNYDVYPVRTFASSFLTGHADCILYVRDKITTADAEVIRQGDIEPIKAAFEKLKLPRRDRIVIDVVSAGEGRKAVDKAADSYRELGDSLGFKMVSIRHTPFR